MPDVHPWLMIYWNGWEDLNQRRLVIGDDYQPIPYTEIEAYVRVNGITDENEVSDFLTYIPLLDSLWLQATRKRIADQREKERKKAKTRRGSRR